MAITYQDVNKYITETKHIFDSMIDRLEKSLIQGRDEKHIPIYSTKHRKKSVNSTYLKTKLKFCEKLEDITDYAGMRVLFLFEQDIYEIHSFLIEIFKHIKFDLKEMKLFNLKKEERFSRHEKFIGTIMEENTKKVFPAVFFVSDDKPSGYKSVHYICYHRDGDIDYPIEVQLRTLIQDVWGELEHALSYKQGNVHPYISKSFRLLAKDLNTMDEMIGHLKSIGEKEKKGLQYSLDKGGPSGYFDYEKSLTPDVLKNDPEAMAAFKNYKTFICGNDPRGPNKAWVTEARSLFYKSLHSKFSSTDLEDAKCKYFVEMEKAYLDFCERKYDKAEKTYKSLLQDFSDHYCPFFRLGEIHFIKGEIEQSLACFDASDALLDADSKPHILNKYAIKFKLSYIYWLLGNQYIKFTLENVREAEIIFKENEVLFEERRALALANSACWYELEELLLAQNNQKGYEGKYDELFKSTQKRVNDLEAIVDKGTKVSANTFDTLAWFYYQAYQKTGNRDFYNKALAYGKKIDESENYAFHSFLSYQKQRDHLIEILSAK